MGGSLRSSAVEIFIRFIRVHSRLNSVLQIVLDLGLSYFDVGGGHAEPDPVPGVVHVTFKIPNVFRVLRLGVSGGIPSPGADEFTNEKLRNDRLPSSPDAGSRWVLKRSFPPFQRFAVPKIDPHYVTIAAGGGVPFH